MSFGAKLKKAREKAGLSIPAAAARVPVSQRMWAYFEADEYLPPAERDLPRPLTRERLLRSLEDGASPGTPNNKVRDARAESGASPSVEAPAE